MNEFSLKEYKEKSRDYQEGWFDCVQAIIKEARKSKFRSVSLEVLYWCFDPHDDSDTQKAFILNYINDFKLKK